MWVNGGIFHWLSIPLSFVVVPVSVLVSRSMIPVIIRGSKEDDDRDVPLNINLAHEMVRTFGCCYYIGHVLQWLTPHTFLFLNGIQQWADVKLRIFLIGEKTFPYVVRLICWWYILNSLTFGILYGISKVTSRGSSPSIC